MAPPAKYPWSFGGVCVSADEQASVVAGNDEATDQRVPVSAAFRQNKKWLYTQVPFVANSICAVKTPEPAVLVMGVGGWVLKWTDQGVVEERVDDSEEGPQNY